MLVPSDYSTVIAVSDTATVTTPLTTRIVRVERLRPREADAPAGRFGGLQQRARLLA